MSASTASGKARVRSGPRETIALLAGLMALNAFAIDAMIPALPALGADLGVTDENDRQMVVIAYMIGFGSTQLVWGPLADRFGRKPVLAVGIGLYAGLALLCGLANSFAVLVAARALQGASAAVTRVLVVAMARDLFEGEEMARVVSLVFMVFMVVPVLAPSIGQLVLLFGPWRLIFLVLAAYGVAMLVWSWIRLPESLHPEYRRTLAPRDLAMAARQALTDRLSLGYTLALTTAFGALFAYIASIQQIVFDAFGEGEWIGLVFAAIAAPMAFASWANSRVIGRFGLRRVGHAATAAFVLITWGHAAFALAGQETLASFILLQALAMCCFAFTSANLGTMAMERMAPIAGTASSLQGTISTIGAATIGFAIGQAFDGTVLPFLLGTAACATAAFLIVLLTEPKRLFAPLTRAEAEEVAELPPQPPEDLG